MPGARPQAAARALRLRRGHLGSAPSRARRRCRPTAVRGSRAARGRVSADAHSPASSGSRCRSAHTHRRQLHRAFAARAPSAVSPGDSWYGAQERRGSGRTRPPRCIHTGTDGCRRRRRRAWPLWQGCGCPGASPTVSPWGYRPRWSAAHRRALCAEKGRVP